MIYKWLVLHLPFFHYTWESIKNIIITSFILLLLQIAFWIGHIAHCRRTSLLFDYHIVWKSVYHCSRGVGSIYYM